MRMLLARRQRRRCSRRCGSRARRRRAVSDRAGRRCVCVAVHRKRPSRARAQRERPGTRGGDARRISRPRPRGRAAQESARVDRARMRRRLGADAGRARPLLFARGPATGHRVCGGRISDGAGRRVELELERSAAARRSGSGAHAAHRRPCSAGGRGRWCSPISRGRCGCVAEGGRDAFYEGEIAERLVALSHAKRAGCSTREDLAAYRAEWQEPIGIELQGLPHPRMPAQWPGSGGADCAQAVCPRRLRGAHRAIRRNAGIC